MDSESAEKGVKKKKKDLGGELVYNVIYFFSKWKKTSVLSGVPYIIHR